MVVAVELGLIYAVMALGVYLTFRILDFPDLTVDGSFTTGGATAATLIISGTPPLLATAVAGVAGLIAGVVTGLLHTRGRINGLLAGILTQIGLYSINLRIMGDKANLPLLREDTLLTPLRDAGLLGTFASVGIFAVGALVLKLILDWFLHTDTGLAMQATGDNEEMIRSLGVSTDRMKVLGLALSNGLVAVCGALIAQYQGFSDIGMGIGLIVAGLASVIIGQAIIGQRVIFVATLAVVLGSVLYRVFIQVALESGLKANDMKLVSAVLVVLALVLPQWSVLRRFRPARRVRAATSGAEA
ncbi:ABC transporter permease [Georgenia sp. SUBG003]|uniref:ABC transporter permease n=1 Tax=Georgenia sp. SUBG003 TaxID=1497974 RepID=UPI0005BC52F5